MVVESHVRLEILSKTYPPPPFSGGTKHGPAQNIVEPFLIYLGTVPRNPPLMHNS